MTRTSIHRGFTLMELMIVITIMAVVTALVVPQLTDDDQLRLVAASSVLRSDLEMAQVMTITNPDEPVVVRFGSKNDRYWLALASAPETPIVRSDTGETYLVVFGQGRASAAEAVTVATTDLVDRTLTFDSQGGVSPFTSNPAMTVSTGGKWIRLDVDASTGTVSETAGSD